MTNSSINRKLITIICSLGVSFAVTQNASADVWVYHRGWGCGWGWGWHPRPCVVVGVPHIAVAVPPVVVGPRPVVYAPEPSLVVSVQHRLKELGYYYGPVDGVVGPETRSAMSRFQRANGLAVTGDINTASINLLKA